MMTASQFFFWFFFVFRFPHDTRPIRRNRIAQVITVVAEIQAFAGGRFTRPRQHTHKLKLPTRPLIQPRSTTRRQSNRRVNHDMTHVRRAGQHLDFTFVVFYAGRTPKLHARRIPRRHQRHKPAGRIIA